MDPRPQSEPPRWMLITTVVLCLAGLAIAGDLTSIHWNVHNNPSYRSFCAISEEVNCDTVAQSDYSVFLRLPVSVWGLFGYLAMGVLAALGLARRKPAPSWPSGLLLVLTSVSVVVSVALLAISKLVIHSMCLMCMASWTVSTALFVLSLVAVWKTGVATAIKQDVAGLVARPRLTLTLGVVALALLAGAWTLVPRYWEVSGEVGPGKLATGVDESGSPWIGAREPLVVVEEFSDYQCPFCSMAHRNLRELIEARADKVRLVHRNYPLDNACNPVIKTKFHESACLRAKAAVCAGEQGKFWEMNDLLFLGQKKAGLDVGSLAAKVGLDGAKFAACMDSQKASDHVKSDMEKAGKFAVKGTPSYVVAGELFVGQISAQELDKRLKPAQ
ncbi:MAG: vitamin K epoxide reductase family protein [Myxococcales bacterium]